ncbi:hypothetical protein JNK62_00075 [bacterium]|nr:hypothetical protein [bacterium]
MQDLFTERPKSASAFKQPLLEVTVKGDGVKKAAGAAESSVWFIDVDGQIDQFISKNNTPKKPFIELCKKLARSGVVVTGFQPYKGSGGPNFLLRNGELFHRLSDLGTRSDTILSYEYRVPVYRGPPKS